MDSKGISKEEAFDIVRTELDAELQEAFRQSSSLYWNGTLGQSDKATELIHETSYKYMKMEERLAELLTKQYSIASKQAEQQLSTASADHGEAVETQGKDNKKEY
jgi:hypothetical protein